jgi:LysM repeat protein
MADDDAGTATRGKKILGLPSWSWILIAGVGAGALYFVWKRKSSASASAASNAPSTAATAGTSQTNDQPSGLATDQYESLLALLRDMQSQEGNETETEPPPLHGGNPPGKGGPPIPVGGPPTPTPKPTPKPAPPPAPKPAPPPASNKTYTVKSGDTLWAIAPKVGLGSGQAGVDKLYNYDGNAQTIRAEAEKHGFHSDFQHWIFPGEVLHLP